MDNPPSENGERPCTAVACPRCQSLNTKFCYFNNHNSNQPRHFCRDCQRYWTAGGSLRNVPVGAGKRKHKGPLPSTTKIENLPNIFSFSAAHLDAGVYTTPLNTPSVLSLKQHVAHTHSENKLSEMPTNASQSAFVGVAKPVETSTVASHQSIPVSHGNMNVSGKQDLVRPPGPEKVGFSDAMKKPSLALGLTFSKETDAKEDHAKLLPHINVPHDFTSLHHGHAKLPPQHATERDESTVCSSVTNLGSSASEAFAESNTPSMRAPPVPSVDQAPSVLNPMAAWGASMCPPWLWPFIMNSRNITPPAGVPQVDPTFAAAMRAMASMPPIHPAFAAAMGAMASGGSLPQVDPNIMAALTASFLQFPHLWNPYTWGLPWNAAWNMTNASVNAPSCINAPNGINKRPASPTQENSGASKLAKKDPSNEAAHSNSVHAADVANAPKVVSPAGYFDAFHSKADAFHLKDTATQRSEEHSDLHQHQSPHTNPAAQARSAAFHEGN